MFRARIAFSFGDYQLVRKKARNAMIVKMPVVAKNAFRMYPAERFVMNYVIILMQACPL